MRQRSRLNHLVGCGWFWAWAIVGAGAVLVASSLGFLLLAPLLFIGGAMASSPPIRRSAFGLLTGAGVVLLVIAYLQRRGPGNVCWNTSTAAGCDSYLDPRPWLVAGIVLVATGILGHLARRA